ncbi:hypothetical protein SNF32_10970 [Enterococcus mundtii]|nr:hypothetical protein [Enterococcus mundtii]
MTEEKNLSTKYNPQEVEAGRYQNWLDEDLFKPSGDKKQNLIQSLSHLPM